MSEKFLIGKKNPKQTTQIFDGVVENEKTHTCTVLNGNINILFLLQENEAANQGPDCRTDRTSRGITEVAHNTLTHVGLITNLLMISLCPLTMSLCDIFSQLCRRNIVYIFYIQTLFS